MNGKMPVKLFSKFINYSGLAVMLVIVFNVAPFVNLWAVHNSVNHDLFENDDCFIKTGEDGVCTLRDNCTVYMNALKLNTILYSDIVRCSFDENDREIICCPKTIRPVPIATATTTDVPAITTDTIFEATTTSEPFGLGEAFSENDSCTLKTGETGVCKRLDNCPVYDNALKENTIQYGFLVRCSFDDEDREIICCPSNEAKTEKLRPSEVACQRYRQEMTFNILNGSKVANGRYPYMAALMFEDSNGLVARCGGSLISEKYVLTAAHCLSIQMVIHSVRLGVNSLRPNASGYDVRVEKEIIHPEYRSRMKQNDLALLLLKGNIHFTDRIRPTCLYSDPRDIDSNIRLSVIGWGMINIHTKETSDDLLEAFVKTEPLNKCNKTFVKRMRSMTRLSGYGLNQGHYCAGNKDDDNSMDSCRGDSGGPLQLVNDKNTTIVGIVSYGESCGSAYSSIYVRVAYYLPWIESIVWPPYE